MAKLSEYITTSDAAISPQKVVGTGATDIRRVFTAEEVPIILRAYVQGIQTAFIVAIALAAACTIIAFAAVWKKLEAAEGEGSAPSPEKSVEEKLEV